MKCDHCGYDDKGTGDTAHACTRFNKPMTFDGFFDRMEELGITHLQLPGYPKEAAAAPAERQPVGYKMVHERPGSDIGFAWTLKQAAEMFGPKWTAVPLYEAQSAQSAPLASVSIRKGAISGFTVGIRSAVLLEDGDYDIYPKNAVLAQPAPK